MRSTFRNLVAVGLLSAATAAHAGLGPNGLGPNGLGPNGLGPNGLGPNGLGPNGLGPNGLGPNGLGPNGLGPNGLGPNGLGPNGLRVNGLGPNGLGPNGLGPNGLIYLIIPSGMAQQSTFRDWFEGSPASASTREERAQFMKYFARCAYDASTAIAFVDSTGTTWAWTGQYGLAMTSLGTITNVSYLGDIRTPMTVDEGKWVSACILAHVNMKGTHQYISLRGDPRNKQAKAALSISTGELWTMNQPHGAYFGDLFGASRLPSRWSCRQHSDATSNYLLDVVLGRSCDSYNCTWTDPATNTTRTVIENVAGCVAPWIKPEGWVMDPLYDAYYFHFPWENTTSSKYTLAYGRPQSYHPIFVNGPRVVELELPPKPGETAAYAAAQSQGVLVPRTSNVFDASQSPFCATTGSCSYAYGTAPYNVQTGSKLVGLRAGQSLEGVIRYTGQLATQNGGLIGGNPVLPKTPDMTQAFTALIRYSNCRATRASAALSVSTRYGALFPVGSEIWPSTVPAGATSCANGESFEWLQVYPVYGFLEDTRVATAGVRPTLKIRLDGATQGESCTDTKLLKGDGERGTCATGHSFYDVTLGRVVCDTAGQGTTPCRGRLVQGTGRFSLVWTCQGGGKAIYACKAEDAPALDAFTFVPTKPYCMPEGETSFVGVCK